MNTKFHKGDVVYIRDGKYKGYTGEVYHVENTLNGCILYSVLVEINGKKRPVSGLTINALAYA